MLGFLDRFLTRRSAFGSQGGVIRKQPQDGLLACPRASVVPGAIVRSRARRALGTSADTGRHAPAARAHNSPARAFWISVDPQDTRRTVMSGTPKEVCEVLDELLAMQEFSASAPRR